MKLNTFLGAAIAAISITACQNQSNTKTAPNKDTVEVNIQIPKETSVPYTIANNYFVKNDVKSIDSAKIDSQEKFDAIFGTATTMSKDGKPTPIDFSKQYVIALMLPATDITTSINPLSLQKNDAGEVTLLYAIDKGAKQSYSIVPVLIIIVDKAHDGNVVLQKL